MNELSSSLVDIQNYTQAKVLNREGKLDKEQLKVAKDKAKVAVANLERILSSGELSKNLSKEALEEIKKIAFHHISSTPPSSLNIAKVAQEKLFKTFDKTSKIYKLAHSLIENDEQARKNYISTVVQSWQGGSENQMKEQLRTLIMELAHGAAGHRAASILTIRKEIASVLLKQVTEKEDNELAKVYLNIMDNVQLFSSLELKTAHLEPSQPAKIEELVTQKLASQDRVMQEREPAETIVMRLRQERLHCLNNLRSVYTAVSTDQNQAVSTKYFPNTHSWYVGSNRDTGEAPFELEMRHIAQEHGIAVVTDSRDEDLARAPNVLLLASPQNCAWVQDFVDFSKNEVRVPPFKDERVDYGKIVENSVLESRKNRHPAWISPAAVACVNRVWEEKDSLKAVALASAMGARPIMNLTYSEGGNTLLGQHVDGTPYVIIGKDSFAVSKAMLEKELGRQMTENEVKMAFAIDYGVRMENIHFIEQPGDFHLDMNLAIIGPNTIAVNDSVLAGEQFQEELQEWLQENFSVEDPVRGQELVSNTVQQARQIAEKKKVFEDIAAADLEKEGFKVIRVAGRYNYKTPHRGPEVPAMNFFNMVTATAPDGKKVVVALGVIDTKYSDQFKNMLDRGGAQYDEVNFLSYGWTKTSLAKHGGISCRVKTM